jgi:UDP-N-acetylglucosamine transferase subunit ALG13
MILVVLGTQDKVFPRLLEAVDREIKNGTIKEKVVVQAGQKKYQSDNMEIFDLVPDPEFEKLIDEARIVITHGGAGSILTAIKKNKKVIAAARLAKYKEHHNDHQKQIISEFVKQGYILELDNFDDLGEIIKKIEKFKPKKFVSNTKNMIKLIENYIEDTNNTAWCNRRRKLRKK